jgi:hypothetical protein
VNVSLNDPDTYRKFHADIPNRQEITVDNGIGFVTKTEIGCGEGCNGSTPASVIETIHKSREYEFTLQYDHLTPELGSILDAFIKGVKFLN